MTAERSIFILGLLRRTGTNFLSHLLGMHPEVTAVTGLYEDFLLHHADLLREYGRRTAAQWNPKWGLPADAPQALIRALGRGLEGFLVDYGTDGHTSAGKRLLFKTPSVENLAHFFELFPEAFLLVIVRDGRDTVESGVRSFGWSYEGGTRRWCRGAGTVVEFDRANRDRGKRYRILHYEDLVRDPERELREILRFLDLDVSRYDFQAARALPVYGSSTLREGGEQAQVTWKPVAKTEAFNPLGRWHSWSPYRRRRFAWTAGRLMTELGYPLDEGRPTGPWTVLHWLVDGALAARRARRRLRPTST